jgi:hypothetical protein
MIEVMVENKYLYQMNFPKVLNKSELGGEEVNKMNQNLHSFASSDKTKYFMLNYMNIYEKINQLDQFEMNSYEVNELTDFLLHENQYETLKDSVSMAGRESQNGIIFEN